MRLVEYRDKDGYKKLVWLKEGNDDISLGIPQDIPNVKALDWNVIEKQLHENLLEHNFFTLDDVQSRHSEFINCILSTIKKPIFRLYQEDKS